MLVNNISWAQFASYALIGAGIYYAGLIVTRKIRVIPPRRQPPVSPPGDPPPSKERVFWQPQSTPVLSATGMDTDEDPIEEQDWKPQQEDDQDHSFEHLQQLATELEAIIGDSEQYPDKDSMMAALGQQVIQYPTLSDAAFKSAIGNIIIKAVKVSRDIDITKTETDTLWEHSE